jgi:SAM-dependent methyltransferase
LSSELRQGGLGRAAIWHDVECGSYAADLPLWRQFANAAGGPVLELGSGTGRVALDLARAGLDVTAVDDSPELLAELTRRAAAAGLEVAAVEAAARRLELGRRFAAILAPMQFLHLMGGAPGRRGVLDRAAAHLEPGGLFAAALLAEQVPSGPYGIGTPLPDVREVDGWIYSSLPLRVEATETGIEISRVRQLVSPLGDLREELDLTHLDRVAPQELEHEAESLGLRAAERTAVPPTADHVGSVVCVLEAV